MQRGSASQQPIDGQNELRKAQAAEEMLRRILESAPDGILIVDGHGLVQMANEQLEKIFGYGRQELLGQKIEVLIPANLRSRHVEQRHSYSHSPHTRPMGLGLDLRGRRKDGSEVPVEISLSPMVHDGETHVVAIVRDVTEHKRAQEALRRQAEELARSNADLEQFAMVASHDLQEPLRMVATYCELLRRKYAGKLDADADQYITFAVEGAKRMQRLINGVLTYARVGGQTRQLGLVDCNDACAHARDGLLTSLAEAGGAVEVASLPAVWGREEELTLLFQHLISNAIKFHGTKPPLIRVGATAVGSDWQFAIQDNGIGIEPQHSERIFQMFQRLHARGVYPGEGIGLPVCKKIVEHHGGRIWVESTPGQGATFYFTIPQTKEPHAGTQGI